MSRKANSNEQLTGGSSPRMNCGARGQALIGIRPVTDTPRPRYRVIRRALSWVLRWTFIVIGAVAASSVLFSHLYRVNETIYDPSLFAIGVGGLFSMACGLMLMILSRNSRLRMRLGRAEARCEELADWAWKLKEAEARAASLLEAQGDLIVRRDGDGRISYANDAYCALSGKPREALLGSATSLHSLQHGQTAVLPDGTRLHDEQIMTADGPRWLAWRDVVIWAEGGDFAEVQSVGRDVTARIETERALAEARDAAMAANRSKSRFLAMVSHEIRTPLNGILGMADLLRDTALTPEQTTYVKAVKASGETLLSLIDEILDFSKIEAGKLELADEPFSLSALIEDTAELLAPRAQAKGLDIAADVDERLPDLVMGDAARLRQVLLNLAGNAIKFTDKGGVSIIVEAGGARDEVAFEVRDTGIGITPEQQSRIFEEFEQADGGAGRKFGGTGLGLAISRRIIEQMGGGIAVSSAANAGATFRTTVRMAPAADAKRARVPPPDLAGFAVLIVAPSTIEAALVARRLARWGGVATLVEEGRAPEALAERRWDAVLVDLAVGPGLAAALAAAAGDTIVRRIVLITPGERHRLAALKDAGFNGYLVKPIRAASLKERLTTACDIFEAAPGASAVGATTRLAEPEGAARSSFSVLIAEDNEINALLTRSLLSKLGHRPTVATNGTAALDFWSAARAGGTPYDLVLMDVHMPGLDGLEAARRIRTMETEMGARRTPIVALSASAFAEDRDACLGAGMDGFLVKPLDRHRLAAMLDGLAAAKPIAA
jgi:PAS domain S-box-containing protein